MINRRIFATLGVAATIAATGTSSRPLPRTPRPTNTTGAPSRRGWQGNTGYAVDYPNAGAAIRAAKGTCGSCGYFTFYNSCGAIAYRFGYRTVIGLPRQRVPDAAAAENAARARPDRVRTSAPTPAPPDNRVHMSDDAMGPHSRVRPRARSVLRTSATASVARAIVYSRILTGCRSG